MATNVNISVPTFTDGEGNLLTLDKAIRAAIRASLQSKERTPKIEKDARSQASGAKESGNIKTEPRRDPGAVKKKKQEPLTAGSAASNAEEDQQDGGGGGSGPAYGVPYIIIVNINQAQDDNFDIYLNGRKLSGRADFSPSGEKTGYLYYWDSIYGASIRSAYPSFYYRGSYLQSGPRPKIGSSNTVLLQNVGQNFNGNYGIIYFGTYNPGKNTHNYSELDWSPPDGENQQFNINWPFVST